MKRAADDRNLPGVGESIAQHKSAVLVGRISIVEEQRLRLITDDGRGFLLTVGRGAGLSDGDLQKLRASHVRVRIKYAGRPNTASGVIQEIRAVTD